MLNESPQESVRDRILMLRALPQFAPLDDETITMMAEHSRRRLFRAGERVSREDEPPAAAFLVLDGQITCRLEARVVSVVKRGAGAGLLSILAQRQHGVDAVADQSSSTIEISALAMNAAFEVNFALARNTLRLLAHDLLEHRQQLPAAPDAPAEPGVYPEQPATAVDHLLTIRQSGSLFAEANLDSMLAMARTTTEMRLEPGELLWSHGAPSTWWARIGYGVLRCTGADGAHVDVGTRYLIGLMNAYAQTPRSYEARALSRVVAYRTELDDALVVLENHPDLMRQLIAEFAEHLLTGAA